MRTLLLFSVLLGTARAIMRLTDEEIQRINSDGTATHPREMMKWILSQQPVVQGMEQKDPELLKIVRAADVDGFQERMKELNKGRAMNPETGEAMHPEMYMAAMKMEAQHFSLKSKDPDLWKVIKGKGDIEGVQKLLRERHERAMMEKARASMPPPPATPYDDMGQVDMSFRLRKDDGTEVDMFSLRPKDKAEENNAKIMPPHMVCAACAAFTYQASLALPEAYAMNNKRPKRARSVGGMAATEGSFRKALSQVTNEALEEMCDNSTLFSHEYAIEPGKKGTNILSGPGISAHEDSFKGDESVMLQSMHNQQIGRIMTTSCYEHLLGSEDDEEIGPTAEKAIADGADLGVALRELLCTKRCLLYDMNQEEAKPKKKKKKKKKKTVKKDEL